MSAVPNGEHQSNNSSATTGTFLNARQDEKERRWTSLVWSACFGKQRFKSEPRRTFRAGGRPGGAAGYVNKCLRSCISSSFGTRHRALAVSSLSDQFLCLNVFLAASKIDFL